MRSVSSGFWSPRLARGACTPAYKLKCATSYRASQGRKEHVQSRKERNRSRGREGYVEEVLVAAELPGQREPPCQP